jgi:chromatin structure-remodeling complex subunit RSC9
MYALHHWVRISFERVEKFRFDAFPGLDEGLVDAALRVGSLFYDVTWTIAWDPTAATKDSELDGENGTSDILERIKKLPRKTMLENIQTAEFRNEMLQVVEAVLTIRNMITVPENAVHMARFPPVKDLVCIILNLPNLESLGEVKNYALDIAELITPFMSLGSDDPFYQTLITQLNSEDRGAILTALRAIGRISMNLEETNKLGAIPANVLENISTWILQNDDEFTDACLDFLYQYTAVETNVDTLLRSINPEALVSQLIRLLSHGARRYTKEITLEPERRLPASDKIAPMPNDLREELLRMKDPERIHQWVKCFFDPDPDSFVTQIAAWQAYNNALSEAIKKSGQAATSPAEFIRNCSSIYQNSQPQVLTKGNEQQKFIIGGIRAREVPLSVSGCEYAKCLWGTKSTQGNPQPCGKYFLQHTDMMNHIFIHHLQAETFPDQPAKFKNPEGRWLCGWAECPRFSTQPFEGNLLGFSRHVGVHVKQNFNDDGSARKARKDWIIPAKTMTITYEETATTREEKTPQGPPQAAGIPLSAVLILRNMARNVTKTQSEEELLRKHELGGEGGGWNERLFRPWLYRLWEIASDNRALVRFY